MIDVVIGAEHPGTRAGLARIVDGHDDCSVIAGAADGDHVVDACRTGTVDVCVLEFSAPHLDLADVSIRLRRNHGDRRPRLVAVGTVEGIEGLLRAGRDTGVTAFVTTRSISDQLVTAVRFSALGRMFTSSDLTERLIERQCRVDDPATVGPELSSRQIDLLRGIARGLTNSEIGDELHLSTSTIKAGVSELMHQLGARSRVELATYAVHTGLSDGVNPRRPPTSRVHSRPRR